ncbi:MAG: hypothetical protein JSV54_06380 [Chloroflexota bacterium]|nr:MAG: hypothetical protein JSV54_06380 [Chloroflexota bacterium]
MKHYRVAFRENDTGIVKECKTAGGCPRVALNRAMLALSRPSEGRWYKQVDYQLKQGQKLTLMIERLD